jgi:hypothetical protein
MTEYCRKMADLSTIAIKMVEFTEMTKHYSTMNDSVL